MCTWTKPLTLGCLSQNQGVTSLELEHMRERYRIYRPMDPSPEKTLLAKGRLCGAGLGAVAKEGHRSRCAWKRVSDKARKLPG